MYACYRGGAHHSLGRLKYVYRKCELSTTERPKSNLFKPTDADGLRKGTADLQTELADALSYSSEIIEKAVSQSQVAIEAKRKKENALAEHLKIPPSIQGARLSKKRKKYKETAFSLSSKRSRHVTINGDGSLVNDSNAKVAPEVKPARLVSGLNRVLYQPVTLHSLRDSRTGVYNFDSSLEKITPDYLESKQDSNGFVTPYKDQRLLELARKFERKYVSSTSSMTSALSHLHFLLSNFRPLNIVNSPISKHFPQKNCRFTQGAQFPATIILRKLNRKVRSIDSDRSLDREIILSVLGHSLEEFLTEKTPQQEESYHYSKIDEFVLRSQLDAYDDNLPGTGVFDLKTRAVAAVRHDLSYVEKNNNHTGYEIDKVYGEFESLEREFFELIRSTLLKYSLQARIGKMDGIFVAYHNISRMFGFQYLPLDEIDYIIHSSHDSAFWRALERRNETFRQIYGDESFITSYQRKERKIASQVADAEFKMSIILLKNILTYIEDKLKSHNVKDWKMCKIMMKTKEVTKTRANGQQFNFPVMKVMALALPSNYADMPLVTKNKTQEEILEQIDAIQKYNEELSTSQLDSMIGFEVRVDHFYKSHPDSVHLPAFARVENNVLDVKTCHMISSKLYEDYYQDPRKYRNPSFFHAKDVQTWRTMCKFRDIEIKSDLKKLYNELLDEKLQSLRDQTIVKETATKPNEREAIMQRLKIVCTSNNRKSQDLKCDQSAADAPSQFQAKLRAYAKKGMIRRKHMDALERQRIGQVSQAG
ncbi:hypothetical protein HG536_0F03560 [Torulaspora globosa]|uniref:Pet127p n=1 Tax=Torulaspora globosa TaxID=48254 RepID=A0A7G3ZKJ5_9SACH|nr:uncharacterized protein HG536_0F03560 [Torulaspora globosa]QLL34031.1 hypothetical protein HG536_0F03560 [Torulaspora globosa]